MKRKEASLPQQYECGGKKKITSIKRYDVFDDT